MTLAIAAVATLIAAIIQRITGLGFVLALFGPLVLIYGAVEGTTIAVLLALAASLTAIPMVWRDIDWRRFVWIALPGIAMVPLGAMVVRMLDEAWLLILIALLAFFALTAGKIPSLSRLFVGRTGAMASGAAAGFMHATSGLSGPPLAAHAVGDRWNQRSFTATVQVIFAVLSLGSVITRGLPTTNTIDVSILIITTVLGIIAGSLLSRFVPAAIARRAMIVIAWCGGIVALIRGILLLMGIG
ncbi:TSUP family transporter [Microbacterium sp. NC79]|uniref:TSUP family transporter n=1 Tax=Microbacterium sp. NC79 TaxID=2851009 RepID=UPI001C2BD311|nr:TSUP family transporter [Microbacterium sp. NC79]MBV0894280.1 TSUP family transporter [Microbacterium sp. NC79]